VRSRRFSVWQKVVALAPLLLLAVYLPGQMMMRCRIDGSLRPACCCPNEAAPSPDSGPVVKAQGCCDRELSTNDRPAIEPAQLSGQDPTQDPTWAVSAALALAPTSSRLAESVRPGRDWPSHGPPREGPPIVLLKHAFLI
jgi:hypothetical protein